MRKFTIDPTDSSFVQLLNRIMFDTSLSMGARLTYAALVEHYNAKDDKCWPSMERLGTMVGVCARTIQNYIKELIARGLVTVLKRGCWSRANEYRLHATVPPRTAPESQPARQDSMRNLVSRDTRDRTSVQPYQATNSYKYGKKRGQEAGALDYLRRKKVIN